MRSLRASHWRKLAALTCSGGMLWAIIPFGCGQESLRLVTPILLDDTSNLLDDVIKAVAPLVLP